MRKNRSIIIAGQRGYGKSTLAALTVASCRRLIILDTLHEYNQGSIITAREDVYRLSAQPAFRIIFRPLPGDYVLSDIDWISYLAMATRDMTVLIEEADNYTNSNFLSEGVRQLVHYGRHYSVSWVMVSRMIQRIRTDISCQADDVICFHIQGESSLKYLAGLSTIENVADAVKALPKYKYICITGNFSLDNLEGLY